RARRARRESARGHRRERAAGAAGGHGSDFRAPLRDARRSAPLTQTELAARTPVSTATISRYLVRGENHPLRDTLVAMCRALGPLPRPVERRAYHSVGRAPPPPL